MDNKKQRKTDRRTTYTINTVKDAMLELLEKEPFDKITVASLCRQAEITRTTFYLHFSDITAVLDELLKDALQVAENSSIQDKDNILPIYAKEKNIEKIKENDILLPVCQRIANSPKYRVLFLDETLSPTFHNYLLCITDSTFLVTYHFLIGHSNICSQHPLPSKMLMGSH